MKNFIWNRDPQEAMDNPYEYEAQEQFRNESEKLVKALRKLIISKFSFKLNEKSTEKAIFMLTINALDSAFEIVQSLNNQSHRVTAHLLRTIDESIDLGVFFNSKSEKSERKVEKWFNDEIISHSDYRDYIKQKEGEEKFELERNNYRKISKFSHNSYKTLLYSYIKRSDEAIVHGSLYESGILIPVQTIAMYHAISGFYFQKIAFKMVEFKLIELEEMLNIMLDSQEENTIGRKFVMR
ncbi:hypothetical protein [Arenibacter certesii]|uniref:Uncharacterized protein n=1 Tax=Arenibacter certesii TaxID=228955 RepID=A0A918INS2_9FLAO|nr:hypothetical protein [Arenibacter certesii]GGW24300.1 hypothetical protein GCM10007383_05870 [Arenibacter certesii]